MIKRIFLATMFTLAVGLAAGYLLSRNMLTAEVDLAVKQCTAEVAEGCPLLYQYVSELERENSRLNIALSLMIKPDLAVAPVDGGDE